MAARKPKRLPKFLQANEPEAMLRATDRQRDRLLLMTLLYLGLRVAELCHLAVEDIDFTRGLVMVREGKGSKDRCLPLPKRLAGPLRGWIGPRQAGPVFPSPRGGELSTRSVQLLVKRMAIKAELRDAAKPRAVSPHKLRHAFASRMLERGATIEAVREALGHASIATTAVYVHCSPDHLRSMMEV